MENNELNHAIIQFIGYGSNSSPQSNQQLLYEKYGEAAAHTLINSIEKILQSLNAVNIDWSKTDLADAGRIAAQTVQQEYPILNDEALKALAWKYSFDWR